MAKPLFKPAAPATPEIETTVTLMRKVGPEHFEVLTGVVRGPLSDVKVLETRVSMSVGRGTARKALAAQHQKAAEKMGLTVDS